MGVIPRLLFALVLIVVPIVVWTTSAALPARVATHFARGGLANGWMPHDGYVVFMLLMTTALPLIVVAVAGFIPRLAVSQISQPKRAYWLSPQRREQTLAWLASHACTLGALIAAFLLGIHLLTVDANQRAPARLDEPAFFVVLAGFLVLLVIWIATMAMRFARTR